MRILLVDDDASVLQTLMAILKTIPGHDVRLAANSQKAHEHAANMGGVDLLISDVVMEPTDGFTMRSELQAMYPKMRVVFISGYDLSDYSSHLDGALVVTKPVDAGVIRGIVENSISQLVAAAAAHQAAGRQPQAVAAQPAVARAVQPSVGIPSSVPQASPRAAAVAQPQAVPQAQPVARAVPVAQPQAQAVPQAQSVPQAQPVQTVAQAVARAVAQPQAVQSGVRSAIQHSGIRTAPAGDPLVGVQLGDYRVQQFLGKGQWGSTYLAIQLSVNRQVGLKVLDLSSAQDDNARNHFLADARAKAAVQHPFIVSVFEADERNGLVFYTQEYLEGATLEDIVNDGQQVDEKTALHVLKVAGEGLHYLWAHNLAHSLIDGKSIRIGHDGIARLANLATSRPSANVSADLEIRTIGEIVSKMVPPNLQSTGLRTLFSRMSGAMNPIGSWPLVLQAVKALEPKVVPVEAAKIKAADAAAQRAVEAVRKQQKRALVIQMSTLGGLVLLVAFFVWFFLLSNKRDLTQQIQIPAGTYIVGPPDDQRTVDLGAFEIDQYEVTIGDYAKFIEFCQADSANEHKYDHPKGQRHIPHVTRDVLTFIGNAKVRGGTVFADNRGSGTGDPGVAIDLNCPMIGITFWDAYAYANWKGRDLPTEEEWEAAARGSKGFKYPWGDELKASNMNSNEGYVAMKQGSTKPDDGYNYWAPVDQFPKDQSPFKVVGMGGNVAEWVYKKEGARELPMVKGGSFASPILKTYERMVTLPAEDCWYTLPASAKATVDPKKQRPGESEYFVVGDPVTPSTRTLYIGFRTVKRK